MYSPRLYKYRDSYVLYVPTVHTFSSEDFKAKNMLFRRSSSPMSNFFASDGKC